MKDATMTSAGKLPKMPKPGPKSAKLHSRSPKKSEADLLTRGRQLAAAYIARRDGMDPDIAAQVVEGMEPEEINAINFEANSSVIERTNSSKAPPIPSGGTPENAPEQQGAALAPAPVAAVDFLSVPLLAADEDFASLTLGIPELAAKKKQAEETLKAAKKIVVAKARAANALKLTVAEWNVSIFEGGSSHIDGLRLIEAGVDPAVVKKCTVKTRYWDVKVTPPGTPKGEANGEQANS